MRRHNPARAPRTGTRSLRRDARGRPERRDGTHCELPRLDIRLEDLPRACRADLRARTVQGARGLHRFRRLFEPRHRPPRRDQRPAHRNLVYLHRRMSALHPTTPRFKQNAREALANRQYPGAPCRRRAAGSRRRAPAARAAMPEFDALARLAPVRSEEPRARPTSADYLEAIRDPACSPMVGGSIGPKPPRTPAPSCSTSADKAGAKHGQQGQDDDLGGMRDQRPSGGARHLEPVETDLGEYIVQLSAARCPATSSPPRST